LPEQAVWVLTGGKGSGYYASSLLVGGFHFVRNDSHSYPSTLPGQDVHRILEFIANAEVVELDTIASISRDAKDDKFLATARVGKAQYLVSEDRDLLDISEYEGTKIITAEAFLRILDESSVEAA